MNCPFDDESTLPDIVDGNEMNNDLAAKIQRFKSTLTPDQRVEFNFIDDALAERTTLVQKATIEAIHCPTCRTRKTCKEFKP